jgi:hypothetical protein
MARRKGERGRETYLQAAQVDLPRRAAFLEAAVRRTERWRRRRAGRARAWRRVARRASSGGAVWEAQFPTGVPPEPARIGRRVGTLPRLHSHVLCCKSGKRESGWRRKRRVKYIHRPQTRRPRLKLSFNSKNVLLIRFIV